MRLILQTNKRAEKGLSGEEWEENDANADTLPPLEQIRLDPVHERMMSIISPSARVVMCPCVLCLPPWPSVCVSI